jgi:hypothetical protein
MDFALTVSKPYVALFLSPIAGSVNAADNDGGRELLLQVKSLTGAIAVGL